jgi:Cu+-exporting ATPase
VAIAVVTALAWATLGPQPRLAHAFVDSVAVLIIACPCALGLATPMSIMVGIGRAAELGVLFKDADALERLERVDTLLVDKTGTLTEGKPAIASIEVLERGDEKELLAIAAALERSSEHPLASAFVAAARERAIAPLEASEFHALPGKGVVGRVAGREAALGNARLFAELEIEPGELAPLAERESRKGRTPVLLALDRKPAAVFAIGDPIRASTPEALRTLRDERVRVIMVSGDRRASAEAVAKELGIEEVHADVPPEAKSEIVARLQADGRVVAMAGDGINDAPALARADVGIAIGTGADVAIHSAGVTLIRGDLRAIARARRLSRAVMRNIRQNLFFAFVYNALGVPIAAGVAYPLFALELDPMIAGAAMSVSSVSVIANALRLRRVEA